MNEGIYFADAELPFHVWVRERKGDAGYKWVLRETCAVGEPDAAPAAEARADGQASAPAKRAA
jgi:hypothetical protein